MEATAIVRLFEYDCHVNERFKDTQVLELTIACRFNSYCLNAAILVRLSRL